MAKSLPVSVNKLYSELAEWWPLFSAPADYEAEAAVFRKLILENSLIPVKTILELGSGGGNNALFLKNDFQMTLVDLSPEMLKVSKDLNPDCKHREGDMRTVRLEREFDAVFIHDAIMYMLNETDLQQAIETAYLHCQAGGVVLLAPDCTRENFQAGTSNGGHDGAAGSVRYLEWNYDPDPNDTTCQMEFAIMIRKKGDATRVYHDAHTFGLFPRDTWINLLNEAGFTVTTFQDQFDRELFIARKPEL